MGKRIKEITQITSKTTAVALDGYDGIVTSVPLTDASGGAFSFTVNNPKVRALSTVLVSAEYPALNGNSSRTVNLTGASGTANIAVRGVNYLATFTTNLTTSANNFVTTHSATLLALGIVVTANAGVLTFVASTTTFPAITITNATGDLAGTLGTVTAVASTGNAIANIASFTKGSFVVRVQNIGSVALNSLVKLHFKITHD